MREMFLEGVGCRRGGVEVFRGVAARVREGGALWVAGANGCGKTSLLRIVAGLLVPAAGRVEARGGAACFVGERNALRGEASGRENLRFWAAFFGSGEEGVERGAERFRLRGFWDAPVGRLSAGQRRRVALARLYAGASAGLWILDEPAMGLDALAREWLAEAIGEHRREGGMVVAASHEDVSLPGCEVLRLDADCYRPVREAAE